MSFFELSFLSKMIWVCTIVGGISLIIIGLVLSYEMYELFNFPDSNQKNEKTEEEQDERE